VVGACDPPSSRRSLDSRVHDALALADEVADEVSIEVFDPRTLYPFDWKRLAESLTRTGRLVVYDDANRSCGFAAEVLATVAEEIPLAAAPRRVTRADVPISFAVELELVNTLSEILLFETDRPRLQGADRCR
jgi:pyruvate/2-oxoglutarate/acetoin dehydrogenase E1 component